MPILNYTTKISPAKTAGEIQELLVKGGAKRVQFDYDTNGVPSAIEFEIATQQLGYQRFRYAPNVEGVLASLKEDPKVPRSACTREQAEKVAWRIEKDWLEAMMGKILAAKEPLEKIMLPYMVQGGSTVYEIAVSRYNALPAPDDKK